MRPYLTEFIGIPAGTNALMLAAGQARKNVFDYLLCIDFEEDKNEPLLKTSNAFLLEQEGRFLKQLQISSSC